VSGYNVIKEVALALQDLLRTEITNSGVAPLAAVPIELESPAELKGTAKAVSLWLYRVAREADTLNYPPPRPAPDLLSYPPLPLTLHFLITPLVDKKPDVEQEILGKVLQVFNDHPMLRGTGFKEEVRIVLDTPSVDDLTRVWDALKEPYQLSVCYQVQVVAIESDLQPLRGTPVVVKQTSYSQIVEVRS
jgi:hypothetical protein